MAELTDSQLMAELEDFEDAQAEDDQGQPATEEVQKAEQANPVPSEPFYPDAALNSNPGLVQGTAVSGAASTEAAKEAAPSASVIPTVAAKKRGLNVTRKAADNTATASKAAVKTTKKIQVRVVHDEEDDQASAAAEESCLGQKAPEKGDQCKAEDQKEKLTLPAKAAADKPGKPVNVKAPVQPKKQADDRKKANVKRAKTAYIFFTAEKRAPVKAENPSLSFGDLTRKLSEMWKELSDEDKAPFEAMAKEDKDRAGNERAKVKAEQRTKSCKGKKKGGAITKAKQQRVKTAYQLFCDDHRQKIKEAHPDAAFGVINSKLAAAWRDAAEENKEKYRKQHQELKAHLPPSNTANEGVPDSAPSASDMQNSEGQNCSNKDDDTETGTDPTDDKLSSEGPAEKPAVASKVVQKNPEKQVVARQKEAQLEKETSEENASDEGGAPQAEDADESIETELMDVDWKAHPAECIVAETSHNKYLVKRKGLDFAACGLVDAKAAKRQRLPAAADADNAEAAACPVTLAMMDEWDAFNRSFRCAVHAHSDGGDLDLDDLNQDSPLEMCHWLGILREPDFPMSRAVKNKDVMIKVPMLELSKAVQRVAAVERKAAQEAVAAAEVVKEQRIKAEKDLAVKEQEVLQLMAALKEHNIKTQAKGQANMTEE